jgi:two-component system, NarL family, response regulator NreC
MGAKMATRILIADNHGILRQGIVALIEKHSDMEVVGQADNGLTVVELARELQPDVVLMDVSMPKLNGIEATRQIKSELPDVKVLALSVHAKREFVLDMVRAGVSGYMLKECVFDDLVHAIKVIAAGQSYLSPEIATIVLEGITKDSVFGIVDSDSKALTPRENQILQLLTEGNSAKQIAQQLGLSVKTIEATRRQVMEKTEVDNLADLTKYAIREGLTTV